VVGKNEDSAVRHMKFFFKFNWFQNMLIFLFKPILKYLVRSGVIKEVTGACVAMYFLISVS
jgi:hypothetical protein